MTLELIVGLFFLVIPVFFLVFIFTLVSTAIKFVNKRKNMFHNVILKGMEFQNANGGLGSRFFGGQHFDPNDPLASSQTDFNQFNAGNMTGGYVLNEEQLNIYRDFVGGFNPQEIKQNVKKSGKKVLLVLASIAGFIGIIATVYNVVINFFAM